MQRHLGRDVLQRFHLEVRGAQRLRDLPSVHGLLEGSRNRQAREANRFALIVGKEHRALPHLFDDFCGWSRINDGCWLSVEDFRAEWDRVRKIVELCREGDAEVRARTH